MTARPDVIPLYPARPLRDEAKNWQSVFRWIAEHPPAEPWRQDPRARALLAAADHYLGVTPRPQAARSRRNPQRPE